MSFPDGAPGVGTAKRFSLALQVRMRASVPARVRPYGRDDRAENPGTRHPAPIGGSDREGASRLGVRSPSGRPARHEGFPADQARRPV
jgi:hypothetical protein